MLVILAVAYDGVKMTKSVARKLRGLVFIEDYYPCLEVEI
jgi:hypothetical protein